MDRNEEARQAGRLRAQLDAKKLPCTEEVIGFFRELNEIASAGGAPAGEAWIKGYAAGFQAGKKAAR